ncbi:CHC2 zinc finger domain-containing protein [Chengkuizengella sp. 2205SS18-9]|uniref:CHC2 zinc finger domain-containing protein n=1 Tax=Chengkuizengella axinellae TaxID=3064388 RepID=A0ABT9J444_9BACL|nr:CHC2 zinc finger domain-containing protein [Chengkuizengella sp. 2205SS18-9]MDP5276212.1 CHC2 zinc finger domain-containing protein [Chengkuizengella sp. 2205SS18-9]
MSDFLPDIYEVAQIYGLSLRKSRSQYKALCPFHEEKTPSFYINPEKNIFKCFGCGEGGGVIKFKAKIEDKSEQEIYEELKSQKTFQSNKSSHPAESLTSFQFREMSEVIPELSHLERRPNWGIIKQIGNEEYLQFRDKVWGHWLQFLEYEKKSAVMTIKFGIRLNSVNAAIEEIRKREKELGVTLFENSTQ